MHPYPRNWVEIGRAVMFYARADQAFSAGIKCRHCMINLDSRLTYIFCLSFSVTKDQLVKIAKV